MIGVQRKTVADLLASLTDGRLAHDALRMADLGLAYLLIEGFPRFGADGTLVGVTNEDLSGRSIHATHFSKRSYWGLLLSVQQQGLGLLQTSNVTETAEMLGELERWAKKDHHGSLARRPKPSANEVNSRRDWGVFLLQSFRGVGAEMAGRVIDHFGGVPLTFTVSEKDLTNVKGVGAKRARQMFELLEKVGVTP